MYGVVASLGQFLGIQSKQPVSPAEKQTPIPAESSTQAGWLLTLGQIGLGVVAALSIVALIGKALSENPQDVVRTGIKPLADAAIASGLNCSPTTVATAWASLFNDPLKFPAAAGASPAAFRALNALQLGQIFQPTEYLKFNPYLTEHLEAKIKGGPGGNTPFVLILDSNHYSPITREVLKHTVYLATQKKCVLLEDGYERGHEKKIVKMEYGLDTEGFLIGLEHPLHATMTPLIQYRHPLAVDPKLHVNDLKEIFYWVRGVISSDTFIKIHTSFYNTLSSDSECVPFIKALGETLPAGTKFGELMAKWAQDTKNMKAFISYIDGMLQECANHLKPADKELLSKFIKDPITHYNSVRNRLILDLRHEHWESVIRAAYLNATYANLPKVIFLGTSHYHAITRFVDDLVASTEPPTKVDL